LAGTNTVVENLQRNELTAREIARAISKSPAFVTQHVILLDLSDSIAGAFNAGRVKGEGCDGRQHLWSEVARFRTDVHPHRTGLYACHIE
jgi:hypothetical protein